MTLIAAIRSFGRELLIGDVVISRHGQRVEACRKIYDIGPNLSVGWTGTRVFAERIIRELHTHLGGKNVGFDELTSVLSEFSDYGNHVTLAGWLMGDRPMAFVWCGSIYEVDEAIVGTGDDWFRKNHHPAPGRSGNLESPNDAVAHALVTAGNARFQETMSYHFDAPKDAWDRTWGLIYEVAVYSDGRFRRVTPVLYLGWDVYIGQNDQIDRAELRPEVWRSEYVHECLVLHLSVTGFSEHNVGVAPPIHRNVDLGLYRRRPMSMRAAWYVQYFRFWRGEQLLSIMVSATTPNRTVSVVEESGRESLIPIISGIEELYRQSVSAPAVPLSAATSASEPEPSPASENAK